jgi:hypothetical protein
MHTRRLLYFAKGAFAVAWCVRLGSSLAQLYALAFCGALALDADVCRGLPASGSGDGHYLDAPNTLAFQIAVQPGGPAFRITVHPLLSKWGSGPGDRVHAGDIEVASCQDGKPLQVVPILAWQAINFAASFKAHDINFDGYLDFYVITEFAGKWVSRSYWVYNPASARFIEDELTRKLGENCLSWPARVQGEPGDCWKAASIDFDSKTHEISAWYFVGVGQCGSPTDRYRIDHNRLIIVHQEILDMKPDGCTVTVSDRVEGNMRVTKVHQFDAKGEPEK